MGCHEQLALPCDHEDKGDHEEQCLHAGIISLSS